MYKKHVFSYPVERSKHKFGETSSAFAGCHCVYVIEDCSSDHNTPMKHVWILHDIYVLKIRLLYSSAIKRSSEDGITSAAIENGVFKHRHFSCLVVDRTKGERKWWIKYTLLVTLPFLTRPRAVELHWSQAICWWVVLTLRSLQTGPISQHIYARNQANSA